MFAYIQYWLIAKLLRDADDFIEGFLFAIFVVGWIALNVLLEIFFPENEDDV